MNEDLKCSLNKLGLQSKEIMIFLALQSIGSATPSDLSKITKLKRTTTYSVLDMMEQKGIITADYSSQKVTYLAVSPESLREVLKRSVNEKLKRVDETVSLLKNYMGDLKIQIPKVVFIQEAQIEKHLYKRASVWNESMNKTGTDYVGFLDYTFTEKYLEWIDWYWEHPTTKNIKLRFLTNETELEKDPDRKKRYKRRNLRFWEKAGEITYNTWINGDYTIMINSRTKPNYLIEIFDKDLAASQREIFNAIWKETS